MVEDLIGLRWGILQGGYSELSNRVMVGDQGQVDNVENLIGSYRVDTVAIGL